MTATLRVTLIVVSMITAVWILHRIRKAQIRIEDSIFWLLFSIILVIMGIFPELVSLGANLVGVYSQVNFVFLAIIFILIVKVFQMSIKISQLEYKLQSMVQRYAIDHKETNVALLEKRVREAEQREGCE